MGRLYGREAELTLARPAGSSFFAVEAGAIIIRDLRFSFAIEKQLSAEPNTCDVVIYNLAETTRAAIQERPLRVFLSAGYDGEVKQIFSGDVRWTNTIRERTGWIAKLQLGDGDRAHKNARSSRSFKGGTSYKQIIDDVAGSMGLKIPTNLAEAREFADQLVSGGTTEGPSHREMTRLLEAKGYNWSIQDGTMQALKDDQTRDGIALVVSEETGMIGSPGFGSPPDEGKAPSLKVETLLYPEMSPGIKIEVRSRAVNGLFKVLRVQHAGDTRGKSWSTTLEASPL